MSILFYFEQSRVTHLHYIFYQDALFYLAFLKKRPCVKNWYSKQKNCWQKSVIWFKIPISRVSYLKTLSSLCSEEEVGGSRPNFKLNKSHLGNISKTLKTSFQLPNLPKRKINFSFNPSKLRLCVINLLKVLLKTLKGAFLRASFTPHIKASRVFPGPTLMVLV